MYPTKPDPFRRWLQTRRERFGVSRAELAAASGVPAGQIAGIEAGELSNGSVRAALAFALAGLEVGRG